METFFILLYLIRTQGHIISTFAFAPILWFFIFVFFLNDPFSFWKQFAFSRSSYFLTKIIFYFDKCKLFLYICVKYYNYEKEKRWQKE